MPRAPYIYVNQKNIHYIIFLSTCQCRLKNHFRENRKVFIFKVSKTSGNVKGLLKPWLDSGAAKLLKIHQEEFKANFRESYFWNPNLIIRSRGGKQNAYRTTHNQRNRLSSREDLQSGNNILKNIRWHFSMFQFNWRNELISAQTWNIRFCFQFN